ncbi:hypothetical protein BVRB_6g144700 [Beta vulgaris subsp. vulgaris]|nr:hypothetical protein BVRB_6g144700 [Beta vulgaris subsp. vulgaris]
MKSSVRMEFLGSDSSSRLYWASAQPGAHPWVIVDSTMALKATTKHLGQTKMGSESVYFGSLASCTTDNHMSLEGSSAPCPFVFERDSSYTTCSQWVYYQSEVEIKELIKSFKPNNPKERDFKDSILNWQKLRCHELHQTGRQDKISLSVSISAEEKDMSGGLLVTRADTLLESKYGPFCQADKMEDEKKRLSSHEGPVMKNCIDVNVLRKKYQPVYQTKFEKYKHHISQWKNKKQSYNLFLFFLDSSSTSSNNSNSNNRSSTTTSTNIHDKVLNALLFKELGKQACPV